MTDWTSAASIDFDAAVRNLKDLDEGPSVIILSPSEYEVLMRDYLPGRDAVVDKSGRLV